MRLLRYAIAGLFVAVTYIATVPANVSASCIDSNPTDDNGVGASSCTVPVLGWTCTARVGASGNPMPTANCQPPLIVCVREPCP